MKPITKETLAETAKEVLPEAVVLALLTVINASTADPEVAIVVWQTLSQHIENTNIVE